MNTRRCKVSLEIIHISSEEEESDDTENIRTTVDLTAADCSMTVLRGRNSHTNGSGQRRLKKMVSSKTRKQQNQPLSERVGKEDNSLTSTSQQRNVNTKTVECIMCLDTLSEIFNAGKDIVATSCGHVYCNSCIKKLFANSSTAKCPQCRKSIKLKNLCKLYL